MAIDNVLFIGSRPLGARCLDRLLGSDVGVAGVIARPDDPARDRELSVAALAAHSGVPLLEPKNINHPEVLAWILARGANIGISVCFNQIYGQEIVNALPRGIYNLHGAPLPEYRGCMGHVWSIVHGDPAHGVCLHRVVPMVDAGPVVATRPVPIFPDDTGSKLHERLCDEAFKLFSESLVPLLAGTLSEHPQDENRARYFPRNIPYDRVIQWGWPAEEIERYLQAMVFPGEPLPHSFLGPWRIEILETVVSEAGPALPGTVLKAGPNGLVVATGRGALNIIRARFHGQRMVEVLYGESLARICPPGTRLGR